LNFGIYDQKILSTAFGY